MPGSIPAAPLIPCCCSGGYAASGCCLPCGSHPYEMAVRLVHLHIGAVWTFQQFRAQTSPHSNNQIEQTIRAVAALSGIYMRGVMDSITRISAVRFLVFLCLAAAGQSAFAQCKPGDVLVGEDDKNYYCKGRKEYASCIGATGQQLRSARPACAAQTEKCFRDNGSTLGTAALSCVLGCLGSKLSVVGCTSVCGLSGVVATNVLEKCGVDATNNCLGDALVAHRKAVDKCKE
jgi:hypothetical protein